MNTDRHGSGSCNLPFDESQMLLTTLKVEIQRKVTEAGRQAGLDEILDHGDLVGHKKRIAGQYNEVRLNEAV